MLSKSVKGAPGSLLCYHSFSTWSDTIDFRHTQRFPYMLKTPTSSTSAAKKMSAHVIWRPPKKTFPLRDFNDIFFSLYRNFNNKRTYGRTKLREHILRDSHTANITVAFMSSINAKVSYLCTLQLRVSSNTPVKIYIKDYFSFLVFASFFTLIT